MNTRLPNPGSFEKDLVMIAGSIGVARIGDESGALLKNQHGVTMQLETKVKGLRFNIAASGLRISLEPSGRCGR
jgi:hypothetical protein